MMVKKNCDKIPNFETKFFGHFLSTEKMSINFNKYDDKDQGTE